MMFPLYENKPHSGVILSTFAYIFWLIHAALVASVAAIFGTLWAISLACGISAVCILIYTLFAGIKVFQFTDFKRIFYRSLIGAFLLISLIVCAIYASLFTAGIFTIGSYMFLVLYQRERNQKYTTYMFAIYVALVIGMLHFIVHESFVFMLGALAGVVFSVLNGITKAMGYKGILNEHPFSHSFFQSLFAALIVLPFALYFEEPPSHSFHAWMILVAGGFFLFLAHYYFHYSYKFAHVFIVGAMSWVGFFVATFIQIGLWEDHPSLTQILGAILVVVPSFALMREYIFSIEKNT